MKDKINWLIRFIKWIVNYWWLYIVNSALYCTLIFLLVYHKQDEIWLTCYGAALIVIGTFAGYLSIRSSASQFKRKTLRDELIEKITNFPKSREIVGIIPDDIEIGIKINGHSVTQLSKTNNVLDKINELEMAMLNIERMVVKVQKEFDTKLDEIKRDLDKKEKQLISKYDGLYNLLERLSVSDIYLMTSGLFWIICGTFVSVISTII